jgi:surface carbohydrate biosynthesis protein (TIGR04326 family)
MSQKSDLLIWDLDNQTHDNKDDVIYWSSYEVSESEEIFSIPHLVEENAEYLKAKYLSLIYDFGEVKVNGKRIIDHLIIRQNFSYWWMTLFVEKCNYSKSPQINNIIKLMALEQWLQENKYQKIKLVSINNDLAMSVSLLADRLLIDFEWERGQNKKSNKGLLKKAFHSLPNVIQSPIWLMYYVFSNWPLKGVGVEAWRKTTATSTFVSYLFNLDPQATKEGRYESRYWTTLTDLLDDKQHSTNWLHIYVKDDLLPSSKKARNFIQRLNFIQKGHQVHVTLASFLSVPLIFLTLKDWYKVLKLNKLVRKQLQVTSGHLWPLFKKDCQSSMSGIPAMSNLLYFNLFERVMNELPTQERGCYLQENIGWEFGFISAWKASGHKKNLIGFPHASVVYWDLRNFFDPRSYQRKSQGSLPLPDYVGINGEVSKNMYLNGGYPQEELIEVESLRYLYLSDYSHNQYKKKRGMSKEKVVLVVGDYLKENTYKQLNLLLVALADINEPVYYIIKPHPACPVNIIDFPGLNGELSTRPIGELMKRSDVVYSSSITSAAIDAYCAGLPIITLLDGKTLNMSPLKGSAWVCFVKNSKDLAKAINTIKLTISDQRREFFYLDSDLPRWHNWLIDDLDEINGA